MDNIIQIERLHYEKICGKKTLLHDLINSCHGKSENLKPQRSPHVLLLLCFLFRSSPPKIILESIVDLKFWKIPLESSRWIYVLVARHGLSYLQKLNCAACCPWNFEAVISRNIFY